MMPSAISSTATIGENTVIGNFCVVGDDVVIGTDCQIGNHVVIHAGTVLGNGVRIDDHATVGKQPMRAARSATTVKGDQPPSVIGHDCIIGTGAVVYAGCTVGKAVLIADLATVREDVVVGDLTIIGRGVAIENHCSIGERCKFETNAYLTAYSIVGSNAFVAPGVLTSNDNFLGRTEERFKHFRGAIVERAGRIGVGAVILPGRTVGEEAVVAAGAVLTRDADPGMILAGIPARVIRPVPEEQKLT